MDEEECIQRLEEQGAKFYVDMDFPANEESLYRYVLRNSYTDTKR